MKQRNCIISKEALTEEQESEEIHRIHSVVKEKSSLIRCADEGECVWGVQPPDCIIMVVAMKPCKYGCYGHPAKTSLLLKDFFHTVC